MNENEYLKQLFDILKITTNKLATLQESCTMEELQQFNPHISFFYLKLLESAVGKKDLVNYLIQLLNAANNHTQNDDETRKRQIERYKEIKRKNEEII